MDDGSGHDQGERAGHEPGQGHEPEHRHSVHGVEDGRRVRADGVERGVPHVEEPGVAKDDIQAQGQDGIQADVVEHVRPVGIEEERTNRHERGKAGIDEIFVHTFSATRSPKSPVGRTIKMRMRTQKAMASFQAMEM